ncbi:asparagine synthase (glutamine-hydrolyzing) [Natranaerofaba carboxydovora]|uniref:asparagine synthase (glutamine-hydrolyzing) n=1 Tax=Natranaerofaba carboxydovora TaxID=2742683 RepID=UPI001F13385E|nr:asparagine synthase (glutamine-hydrolyzing) [Natranaerofaba carboxydovora]UMZ73817.1 Asparagine synthetase [glutamine-hydrolyzing] 1 [Natranaerofaba carboxydovora]
MCGFIGYVTVDNQNGLINRKILNASDMLVHRGPDSSGFYSDDYVTFAFKRLSIIDIEKGNQPLSYQNQRYWIVLNGEIYNYLELKKLLKNPELKTESDTEVVLALYSEIGDKMIEKLRGMYSFLIWDKKEKKLFGARDPFGIKPLYYLKTNNGILFSSEKKALLDLYDSKVNPVDTTTLQHYLTFQYPPEPSTIYRDIKKVPPGNSFSFCPERNDIKLSFNRYFTPSFRPNDSFLSDEKKLFDLIKEKILDSVKIHMRSDVPVGAFLSSGIDSTAIVALAKKFHPKIKTFTSGFESQFYNEADIAKETAEELGVEHYTKLVTAEEVMEDLPEIIWHMDDPVADPAAVPLYYVSKEASKHVKVVLSGEGADELFGGYNIYREPRDLSIFNNFPGPVKRSLFYLSKVLPEGTKGKDFIRRGATPLEKRYYGNARIFREDVKHRVYKRYNREISYYDITAPIYKEITAFDELAKMQYVDLKTWLSGDILVKADRMTMAHSLELRVPFLDKKVFEIASMIPPEWKVTDQTTKYALRKAVEDVIPKSILYRKKLGFPVPIRYWLKDTMYEWARDLIKESGTDYLFNKNEVLKLLNSHRKGPHDYSRKLWTIITFMIWHKNFVEGKKPIKNSKESGKIKIKK